jgi:hypothetical protein
VPSTNLKTSHVEFFFAALVVAGLYPRGPS